ncbi:MAG TPA: AcvB/VirJ family lysyl-phosphatidylglycerol hydrolase [Saprospiraceae bacterium]|nr:hypothetical protein [Lewinellaceae bacterium]HQU54788.1 AcvB/VirJ family lysyl-phosphatidylglycerol hydrolase [Saprospiraceae bacterium]HRV86450.1 AcvB/VirJ family lysyl-phosphatidylglycerol hydrolase [Saprospiraceae bacterium]
MLMLRNKWVRLTIFLWPGIILSCALTAQELQLHITPASEDQDAPLVFFLSGDGGWVHFCQPFSDKMAQLNMPVIGIDSRKYFWNEVPPEKAARELAPVIREYLKKWNRKSILFSGFSFGADVAPFIYAYLPEDLKEKIKLVVLMSPAKTTDFQVHYIDMMGMGTDSYSNDVMKAMDAINRVPVLCIYGDEEKPIFPQGFNHPNIKVETVNGSHHFKDGDGVSKLITEAIR